jgi:hypothetical protein
MAFHAHHFEPGAFPAVSPRANSSSTKGEQLEHKRTARAQKLEHEVSRARTRARRSAAERGVVGAQLALARAQRQPAPHAGGADVLPVRQAPPWGVRGNPLATVSAPQLSGFGTEADPYVATVETEPTFAVTGVRVSESVSYIDGDEQVVLGTTLHNSGATSRQIRAAPMGAPMHGPSLDGFGEAGIEDGHRYVAGINDEQGSYAATVEVPPRRGTRSLKEIRTRSPSTRS